MTTKSIKRATAVILSAAMAMSGMLITDNDAAAAAKPMLASKKGTVDAGKSTTVKIKNVKKKNVKALKVSSSDNGVAIAKKSRKTAFKVTGKSAGKAKITAKLTLKKAIAKKKTYTLKYTATVKDTSEVPVVTEAPAESTITVGSFGELTSALASAQQTGGKVVTLVTQEAGPFEIGEATYDKVDLIVDAPNATITNNASFRSITLKASPQLKAASLSIKAEIKCKWFEKGKNNSITLDNAQAIHVVLQSAGSVAALIVKGSASEQSVIEIISGTLNSLSIISKEPVKIVAKGTGEIKDVTMSAVGGNATVEASENAKVGKVDIKEGTMGVNASGNSAVSTIVVEGASKLDLSGDTKNPTKIDATQAGKDAKVVIEKGVTGVTVEVDKNNATDQKKIVDDQSGQAKVVETGVTTPTKAPISTATPAPSSGGSSGGSSSGGSSGGSSGSGSGGGSSGGGSTAQTEAEMPSFTDVAVATWIDKIYVKEAQAAEILATASINDPNGSLSYQWFKDGVAIEGATTPSLTPATTTTGQVTFYCVATNTDNTKDVKTKTNKTYDVTITVDTADNLAALYRAKYAEILAKTEDTVVISDEEAVLAAIAALEALPAAVQTALNSESTLLNALKGKIKDLKDAAAADSFRQKYQRVLALSPGTDYRTNAKISDRSDIETALAEFATLSDDVKTLLATEKSDLDALLTYVNTLAADSDADAFLSAYYDIIEKNVADVTLADAELIAAARTAYTGLSTQAKAKVDTALANIGTKLTALEAKIADLTAAKEFEDLVKALPAAVNITKTSYNQALEDQIGTAKAKYDTLSDAQKADVTPALQQKYEEVLDVQTAVITAQVADVEELIDDLPPTANIKVRHEDQVRGAKAAYDALTTKGQAAVTAAKVTTLNDDITALENALIRQEIDELAETINGGTYNVTYTTKATAVVLAAALTTKVSDVVTDGYTIDSGLSLSSSNYTGTLKSTVNDQITAALAIPVANISFAPDEALTVSIDGGEYVGATLTATVEGTNHEGVADNGYKWYRVDGEVETQIDGQTGASYTLTEDDLGKKIYAVATINHSTYPGDEDATSNLTGVIKTDISGATITVTNDAELVYTGESLEPTITVTLGGNPLSAENYDVSFKKGSDVITESQIVDAATYTVVITGKGGYTGEETQDFTVSPADISNFTTATVAVVNQLVYTGEVLEPEVTVTLDDIIELEDTDFTVAYKKGDTPVAANVLTDAGDYTVTVTGTGNYTGTAEGAFSIAKGQAELTVTPPEGGATIEYDAGLTANDIKDLFTVENNFGVPAWTFKKGDGGYGDFAAGAGSWLAKVTIADTDNYDGVTVEDIPFTVTPASNAITVIDGNRSNAEVSADDEIDLNLETAATGAEGAFDTDNDVAGITTAIEAALGNYSSDVLYGSDPSIIPAIATAGAFNDDATEYTISYICTVADVDAGDDYEGATGFTFTVNITVTPE